MKVRCKGIKSDNHTIDMVNSTLSDLDISIREKTKGEIGLEDADEIYIIVSDELDYDKTKNLYHGVLRYIFDYHGVIRVTKRELDEYDVIIEWAMDEPDEFDFEDDEDKEINSISIKKVVFNKPYTVVLWEDGTKTVVHKQDGDKWDPEKGLAMAILKKLYDGSHYMKCINYWMEHAIDTSKKKKDKK